MFNRITQFIFVNDFENFQSSSAVIYLFKLSKWKQRKKKMKERQICTLASPFLLKIQLMQFRSDE